ncbi:hypothetical protein HMPREF9244_00698 [Alloscardovia omnicolens F0580]|uniref:Uncharacterized protein n=1 Tax=Alloscardovia omnicolens F0580 TaxID=1321816 RepID=U1QUB6_9BIFI|nr:hypothetical protein HMPREF9244_00698 [Alloscardovia omnicolens F0580]
MVKALPLTHELICERYSTTVNPHRLSFLDFSTKTEHLLHHDMLYHSHTLTYVSVTAKIRHLGRSKSFATHTQAHL